ncbi:hypothetical protein FJZ31_29925 [Candidatus Poribacteria bacterium]|nr:hypothetical protein [Candidatus Poribacteria bacterium]
MSGNKVFILLVVLALVILGLSTGALSQQPENTATKALKCSDEVLCPEGGSAITIDMKAPQNLPKELNFNLYVTSAAEITLTYIGPEESIAPVSLSQDVGGGKIHWEIDFDSLGLPAGLYNIEEKFSGNVTELLGLLRTPEGKNLSLVLSAEFDSWETSIPSGTQIIIDATASGRGILGGTFSGGTEFFPNIPEYIYGVNVTAPKPIKAGDPLTVRLSFEGENPGENTVVTKNTSILRPFNPNPVIMSIKNQIVEEMQTATVALSVIDSDSPLDTLIYSASIGTVANNIWEYTPPLNRVNPPDKERKITVTIIVQDSDGNKATQSFVLTVKDFNPPPVMEAVEGRSVVEGDTLRISFEAADPEGEIFTFGYSVSPPFPKGLGVTEIFDPATGILSVKPDYDTIIHPGKKSVFTVTAWATDARGAKSNEVTFPITIEDTNRLPALTLIGNKSATVGVPLEFTVAATDPDIEDILRYEVQSAPPGATFDGTAGVFSWTPTVEQGNKVFSGVTFFAKGSHGGVDYEIISITVGDVNHPPDITSINGTTALTFPVNEGSPISLTVEATDVDPGDVLTYSATGLPTGQGENVDGTLSPTNARFDPATRTFTWTPGYNRAISSTAAGLYAITFVVSDGELTDSAIATIVVSPTNRPPVLDPVEDATYNENELVAMHVSARDLDGDKLTLRVDGKPANAIIQSSASWDLMWQTDYAVVLPPAVEHLFPMTFRVSDGTIESTDQATLTIRGVNRPPVIRTVGGIEPDNRRIVEFDTAEGQTLKFAVIATDPDPGYILTFSASNVPTTLGASFDAAAGIFSWPNIPFNAEGIYNIAFTVTDSAGDSDSVTVIIYVDGTNQPPLVVSIGGQPAIDVLVFTAQENQILTLNISATDPDNDPVVLSQSGLPTGAKLTGNSIVWQTGYMDAGIYNATIRATDPYGAKDDANITISVINVNQKPILSAIADRDVDEGTPVNFTLSATDPDGDKITYASPDKPADAMLDSNTGAFSWIPLIPGDYNITFTATDNGIPPLSDSKVATIHVQDVATLRPKARNLSVSGNKGPISISFAIEDTDSPTANVSAIVEYKGESETAFSSIGSVSGTGNFSVTWNSAAVGAGIDLTQYVVRVTANDEVGSGTPATSGKFTVDNEAPQLIGDAPGDMTGTTGEAVDINVQAEDNVGITRADVIVNGSPHAMTFAGGNSYTYPLVVPQNSIAPIYCEVELADAVGNVFTTDTFVITATDNDPPVANAGPDQTVDQGDNVTFDGGGSTDNIGIVEYHWDKDARDGVNLDTDLTGHRKTLQGGYPLPGLYTVTLRVKDAAGNMATDKMTVTVNDTEPPAPPVITEILPALITNSTNITVNGTAEADSTVSVSFDGAVRGATKAKADGKFSVLISSVAEGIYNVTANARDAAEHTSAPSNMLTLLVDLTPPVVTITSPQTNVVAIATPPLSADYDARIGGFKSAEVVLLEEGTPIPIDVTLPTGDTGVISATVTRDLIRRLSYELRVTVTGKAGNITNKSLRFTYDPYATDNIPPTISGMSPTGVINQKRPQIKAVFTDTDSGINSETISIGLTDSTLGGIQYNSVTGEAFAYPDTDLNDGIYTATFNVQDNNTNPASATVEFTVDTTGPDAPIVNAILPYASTTPMTVTGTAEKGSTVKATVNGNYRGTATADATTGDFSISVPFTSEGKKNIVCTATDIYGNIGSPSTPVICIYDTQKPIISDLNPADGAMIGNPKPTITALLKDSTALTQDVSGINANAISMTFDGVDITPAFNSVTGQLSYAITTDLVNGAHTVNVSCEDNTGHTASVTWAFTYEAEVIDTTAPTIAGFSPANGALINKAIIDISVYISDVGSGVNAGSIVMRVDGVGVGATFNPDTGQLSYTADFTGRDGNHTVSVYAEDKTTPANSSIKAVSFTTDTGIDPPVLNALASPTNKTTVNITGTVEAKATVEIFQNGVSIGTVKASSPFTMSNVSLREGENRFTAIVRDVAGNTSAESAPVAVLRDTTPPSIGNFAPVGYMNNPTPQISMSISDGIGSGVQAITMMLLDFVPVTGFSYDAATGRLTYTPSALLEGQHFVSVTVSDRAGNGANASFNFYIDVTGPAISSFSPGDGEAIGNRTPTISAVVSDNYGVDASSVEMLLDGSSVGSYEPTGVIQYVVPSDLADGFHTVRVQAMDIAGNGNVGAATFLIGDVTDTVSPSIAVAYPPPGSDVNSTSFYIIQIVLVDGDSGPNWETLTIFINGIDQTETILEAGGGALNRATGELTIFPKKIRKFGPLDLSQLERPTGFAQGLNTIQVRMADKAGNILNTTWTVKVTVEPPQTPTLAKITSPTNKGTVAVTGSVLNTKPPVKVTVLANGLVVGIAAVDDAGKFNLKQAFLVAGNNVITAYATDSAGNRSATSAPINVLLDQTQPVVTLLKLPVAVKTATITVQAQFVDDSGRPPASFKLVLNEVEQVLPNKADVTQTVTLVEGRNTIVLRAADTAGNEATPVSSEVKLDTTGPETAPENLRAGVSISGADIVLTWKADINAATYNIYRDTQSAITNISILTPVAVSISGASWTDIDVDPSITYYYALTSVDAAGNKGTKVSNSPNVTLIPSAKGGVAIISDGTRLAFAASALSYDPTLVAAITMEALADDNVLSLENAVAGSVRSLAATSQSSQAITTAFNKPAQLSIPYLTGVSSPKRIRVFALIDGAWKKIDKATVIPQGNLVRADVSSFGIYRLAILSPEPDVNKDGQVDIVDLMLVSEHFGVINPEVGDVDGDGTVDISDLALVGVHLGEMYTK